MEAKKSRRGGPGVTRRAGPGAPPRKVTLRNGERWSLRVSVPGCAEMGTAWIAIDRDYAVTLTFDTGLLLVLQQEHE